MNNLKDFSEDLSGYVNGKVNNQQHLLIDTEKFWQCEGIPAALLRRADETLRQQSSLKQLPPNQQFSAERPLALVAVDPTSDQSFHPQREHDVHESKEVGYQFYLVRFLHSESSAPDSSVAQLQVFALGNQESALKLLKRLEAEHPENRAFDSLSKKIVRLSCELTCSQIDSLRREPKQLSYKLNSDQNNVAVPNGTSQAPKTERCFALVFLDALEFASFLLPDVISGALLAGIVHFTRSIIKLFVKEPESPIFNIVEKIADRLPDDVKNLAKAINLLAKDFYPHQVQLHSIDSRNTALKVLTQGANPSASSNPTSLSKKRELVSLAYVSIYPDLDSKPEVGFFGAFRNSPSIPQFLGASEPSKFPSFGGLRGQLEPQPFKEFIPLFSNAFFENIDPADKVDTSLVLKPKQSSAQSNGATPSSEKTQDELVPKPLQDELDLVQVSTQDDELICKQIPGSQARTYRQMRQILWSSDRTYRQMRQISGGVSRSNLWQIPTQDKPDEPGESDSIVETKAKLNAPVNTDNEAKQESSLAYAPIEADVVVVQETGPSVSGTKIQPVICSG